MLRKLRQLALGQLVGTVFALSGELLHFPVALLCPRTALTAENLFLRKQLVFCQERQVESRRLSDAARLCPLLWSRLFDWRGALAVVKPDTLIRWHHRAFRLFWHWKSRGGRPRLAKNVRQLIADMVPENPT